MKYLRFLLASALMASFSATNAQKYVGGDLSVLTRYEEQKATYFDKDGKSIADVLAFVKEQGWNTIRVRLFVDPSKDKDYNREVCQDLDYVKALGKRIKDAGLLFMLDFHYSDTWADPEKQYFPSSWAIWSWPPAQTVYNYTKESLEALVAAGATPDFIQTGNEISFGMLWGFIIDGNYEEWEKYGGKLEANASWTAYTDRHWDNLADMLKNAGKACREVCPNAKIIIHTEQCANNPALDVAFFKRIQQNDIDYDIIGVSYYPYFKGELPNLDKGLTQLENNFPDKHIQLVETGYPSKWEVPGTKYDLTKTYPYSHEGQRKYTADLITLLNKHKQVNGLSWWYAEANAKGCTGTLATDWYNASLFDNETGRALPALYELKKFDDGSSGVVSAVPEPEADDTWYTLGGRKLDGEPTAKGVYINHGRKVLK